MFKSTRKILLDSRGIATQIWALAALGACTVVAMSIILSAVISARIMYIRDTSQNSLDAYITTTGREVINSVKSGHDFTLNIKHDRFLKELQHELMVKNRFRGHDKQSGSLIYSIDNIQLDYDVTNSLKMKLSYTLNYRFEFLERIYIYPYELKIESLYKSKY